MKKIAVLAALALAVACQPPATVPTATTRADFHTPSQLVTGDLGHVAGVGQDDATLKSSAQDVLHELLRTTLGGSGVEFMVPEQIFVDKQGNTHVRFSQEINGLKLAGAGMVLHVRPDGTAYAANGEFVNALKVPEAPALDGELALQSALVQAHIEGELKGEPELGYVLGDDGRGHLAWSITVNYENEVGPQRDVVFADSQTGDLVTRHPQFHYARSLRTEDWNQKTNPRFAETVSESSNTINTGDNAIDSAHNYAIATYDYYFNNHTRDSLDDAGMTLISRVHYDRRYNNAFWDGSQMTYGDGDGTTFAPLSQDADVVAHELTHGVTSNSSDLVYMNESGALNEALSDIFGAMVDAQEGATGADIWHVGEDIYTPGIDGDGGIRNMADPASAGDPDFYADRYQGTEDNGGVHSNSGIANLAFQLLSDGGTHPRGKSSVVVPSLGMQVAADIFYAANVGCLTPSSGFASARWCTDAMAADDAQRAAVNAAWDAVGVPAAEAPPAPPEPADPILIEDGVDFPTGAAETGLAQPYYLASVAAGSYVQCSTSGSDGDADLYVRFGDLPVVDPNSSDNDCASYSSTSNESCSTGITSEAAVLYATVHAWTGFTNLTLNCMSLEPQCVGNGTKAVGDSCAADSECCSGNCKGKPGGKTCK